MIEHVDLKDFIQHVPLLTPIAAKESVILGVNYSIEGLVDHLITVGDTTKFNENTLVLSKKLSEKEADKIISRWVEAIELHNTRDVILIIDRYMDFLEQIMNAFKNCSINPNTLFLLPGPDSDLETLYKSTESFINIFTISKTLMPIDLNLLNTLSSNILDFGKKIYPETILKKIIPLFSAEKNKITNAKIIAISYLCNVSVELFNTPENLFKFFKYTSLVNFNPEYVVLSSIFSPKKVWDGNELEKAMLKILKPVYLNSLKFSVFNDENLNNEIILMNTVSKISSNYCYLIKGYKKYSNLTNSKSQETVITQNIIEGCKDD
ncbi:MAG: hypothetical protein QXZ12_08470 [Thermoplasmata archaeon]